jgi:hypothetical protein
MRTYSPQGALLEACGLRAVAELPHTGRLNHRLRFATDLEKTPNDGGKQGAETRREPREEKPFLP